jgi:hypothetical protein
VLLFYSEPAFAFPSACREAEDCNVLLTMSRRKHGENLHLSKIFVTTHPYPICGCGITGYATATKHEIKSRILCHLTQFLCGNAVTYEAWRPNYEKTPAERHSPVQHSFHIQQIREALITSGYRTLDRQAKALGIHRATAWTIIKTKHKVGRLNAPTAKRMLANPQLPPSVRMLLLRYVTERCNGGVVIRENKSRFTDE